MAMREAIKKTLVLVAVTTFSYLLTLVLFSAKCFIVYSEAKHVYRDLKQDGLTTEVQAHYSKLLPALDGTTKILAGPLASPLIRISGYQDKIDQLLSIYEQTKSILPIAPNLLGFDGPRRYFIAFQNPSEARGTGGLIGAFAVARIDKAEITFEQVGSNYSLQLQDQLPIDMPEDFDSLYGDDPAWWPNSNMSPHFPYAAQIWLSLWQKQSDQELDGAIALDPFVLKRILSATGSVDLKQRTISKINVVDETLFQSYLKYAEDNIGRKEYIIEIIKAVIAKAVSPQQGKLEIAYAFASSVKDGRFLLFSAKKVEQAVLQTSRISGALDLPGANDFRLVLINTAGNKMDYFIDRTLQLKSLSCGAKGSVKASFSITNTADPDQVLPDNYYGRQDRDNPENRDNSTSMAVLVFGPPGATLKSAEDILTKEPAGYIKRELSRDVLVIPLVVKGGQTRKFIAEFSGVRHHYSSISQPLVRQQKTLIIDECHR